jgi:hypothetical protein
MDRKENKRKARLQSIVEDELAEPTQIGDVMSSSAAASSSFSIQPLVQSNEEQTTQNLRGRLGPKGKRPRGSQSSAASTEAPPAGAPPIDIPVDQKDVNIHRNIHIDDLMHLAENAIAQMEGVVDSNVEQYKTEQITILAIKFKQYQIKTCMESPNNGACNFKKRTTIKHELIDILRKPL